MMQGVSLGPRERNEDEDPKLSINAASSINLCVTLQPVVAGLAIFDKQHA